MKNVSDLSLDELNALIKDLQAKSQSLGINTQVIFSQEYLYEKDITDSSKISIEGFVPESLAEKIQELDEYVKSLGFQESCIANKVFVERGVGSTIPDFPEVLKLSGEKTSFSHTKGEVLLVDFWATWCGPCQGPMKHNQEMLHQNEDIWKGKARIVGMCFDDTLEALNKRVEENSLFLVEHYLLPGGFSNKISRSFKINGIPAMALVDKEGIVQFFGHPAELDLEKAINDLIEDKKLEYKASDRPKRPEKVPQLVNSTEQQAITTVLRAFLAEQIPKLHGISKLQLGYSLQRKCAATYTEDAEIVVYAFIEGEFADHEKLIEFNDKLNELTKTFPKNVMLRKRIYYYAPVIKITVSNECAQCKKAITSENGKFVCCVCIQENKPSTFCKECGESETEPAESPFHEHPLLYLPPNSDSYLDKLPRLKTVYEKINMDDPRMLAVKQEKVIMNYYCDNCENAPILYDFSCAICCEKVRNSFDLCPTCLQLSQNPNDPQYASFVWNGEHKPEHPMLRIPYHMKASSVTYLQ